MNVKKRIWRGQIDRSLFTTHTYVPIQLNHIMDYAVDRHSFQDSW